MVVLAGMLQMVPAAASAALTAAFGPTAARSACPRREQHRRCSEPCSLVSEGGLGTATARARDPGCPPSPCSTGDAQGCEEALAELREHVRVTGSDLLLLPELPFSDWLASSRRPDAGQWGASVAEHERHVAALADHGVPTVVGTTPVVREGVGLLRLPRATPLASVDRWLAGGRAATTASGAYSLSSDQWIPGGGTVECGGLGWVVSPDGDVLATTSAEEPFVTVEVGLALAEAAKGTYPRYVLE